MLILFLECYVCTENEAACTRITVVVHSAGQSGLNVDLRIVASVVGDYEEVRCRYIETCLRDANLLCERLRQCVADSDVVTTKE